MQFSLRLSKRTYIKPPAPFPLAVYLYKSVTNIPLRVNLQLHRKGRREKKKRYYKNNILVFGYSVLYCFKRNTRSERTACPGSRAGWWWGGRRGRQMRSRAVLHAWEHWLTAQGTPHMACHAWETTSVPRVSTHRNFCLLWAQDCDVILQNPSI